MCQLRQGPGFHFYLLKQPDYKVLSSRSYSELRRSSSVENLPTTSSGDTSQTDFPRPLTTFGGNQITPENKARTGPQLRDPLLRTDLLINNEAGGSSRRSLDVTNSSRGRYGGLRRSLAQDFEAVGSSPTSHDPATRAYIDGLNITT